MQLPSKDICGLDLFCHLNTVTEEAWRWGSQRSLRVSLEEGNGKTWGKFRMSCLSPTRLRWQLLALLRWGAEDDYINVCNNSSVDHIQPCAANLRDRRWDWASSRD